ncbi:MAG: hypothetical protein QNK40_14085 [Desulfobacterales bacterium]|nr:hypothetical protein [Desulfobacterales bacterium]
MPPTNSERQTIMREIILQIQNQGYIYDLGAGASNWAKLPPPPGTRLNCQAAARLAKAMAEERGVDGLKIVATNIKDGFFIPVDAGRKALGKNNPPVRTAQVWGWEFDNHYRVKDPVTNTVYDPVFGTSGGTNLVGVKCTSTQVVFPSQISVYGKKYKIIRTNVFKAEVLSKAPVARQYQVGDKDYR